MSQPAVPYTSPPRPRAEYVYVASSWRNHFQPALIETLKHAKIDHYDFRNPPNASGFGWQEVTDTPYTPGDEVRAMEYLRMLGHPRAEEGYIADMEALDRADTVVLLLPCGRSAHLELGYAVGKGKHTAIWLTEEVEPELMYMMVDYMTPSIMDLLGWLGVED